MTESPPEVRQPDPQLEDLLEHLRRTRGFDFTGYKRTSLERRIGKRMEAVGAADYTAYLDHLEVHPDDAARWPPYCKGTP